MTQSANAGLVPSWTVGDRLRKARELTGLDAEKFADEIGVHRDTVANYEKGKTQRHSRAALNQWALRTGVSLQWLKTGDAGPSGGSGISQESPRSNPGYKHASLACRTPAVTVVAA